MPDQIAGKKVFSLLEVGSSIRKTINERYQRSFWVKAEMNKLNYYSYSGHCYPELVEKNQGKVVAQLRASLWRDDYLRVNKRFQDTLGEPLKDGITILFEASVAFDPVHGLSLRIIDVDPVFSLGALERERLESIARLKAQGIFDHNKRLDFPVLPRRIAIISVETSKGYADFLSVIGNNPWGYRFFGFLFPALLQGDKSVDSILFQLQRIRKVLHHFDVVAIIRGGGGDVGLSSYNNYRLAAEVARFPLPVITGIGHSTNETVTELVSYRNAITPTELADFLIQRVHDFALPLERATETIIECARRRLLDESRQFTFAVRTFRTATTNALTGHRREIQAKATAISQHAKFSLRRRDDACIRATDVLRRAINLHVQQFRTTLDSFEKTVTVMDPVHVLRRGFSITTVDGKVIRSVADATAGDILQTTTADGVVTSTVTATTLNSSAS